MIVLGYILFLACTHVILMQIFRHATYHRHFLCAAPLLAGYAAGVACLMYLLRFEAFFVWHVIISSLIFTLVWRNQGRRASAMLSLVANTDPAMHTALTLSLSLTRTYYWISAVLFLSVFSIVFLLLFNVLPSLDM